LSLNHKTGYLERIIPWVRRREARLGAGEPERLDQSLWRLGEGALRGENRDYQRADDREYAMKESTQTHAVLPWCATSKS
jgi:hypothetical protein